MAWVHVQVDAPIPSEGVCHATEHHGQGIFHLWDGNIPHGLACCTRCNQLWVGKEVGIFVAEIRGAVASVRTERYNGQSVRWTYPGGNGRLASVWKCCSCVFKELVECLHLLCIELKGELLSIAVTNRLIKNLRRGDVTRCSCPLIQELAGILLRSDRDSHPLSQLEFGLDTA